MIHKISRDESRDLNSQSQTQCSTSNGHGRRLTPDAMEIDSFYSEEEKLSQPMASFDMDSQRTSVTNHHLEENLSLLFLFLIVLQRVKQKDQS